MKWWKTSSGSGAERVPALAAALCAAVLLALVSGCSTVPERANMETQISATRQPAAGAVVVRVTGGHDTSVADDDLRAAIEASLARSRLFTAVAAAGSAAPYALTATVIEFRGPAFGLNMTVEMEMAWSLQRQGATGPPWRKVIRSSHTATVGDAMAGVKRYRMAAEGAVRKNIEMALKEIAQLDTF